MANLRTSILVRTDLNLPVGLLSAQLAHLASIPAHNFLMAMLLRSPEENGTFIQDIIDGKCLDHTKNLMEWIKSPYLFIHRVPNKEVLEYYVNEGDRTEGVTSSYWTDTIYIEMSPTQKKAFPNIVVGAVFGPCDSDKIKAVIGDLPLL